MKRPVYVPEGRRLIDLRPHHNNHIYESGGGIVVDQSYNIKLTPQSGTKHLIDPQFGTFLVNNQEKRVFRSTF